MGSELSRDKVVTYLQEMMPALVSLRHELHRIPEIAGEEHQTRALLKRFADSFHPLYWQPKLGTDLVFEIPGRDPGRVIGIRADMDALPVQERIDHPHRSRFPGMMHACGHDGHMAILMGAAAVAHRFRDHLPHTVRYIFQPGEEVACLGAELTAKGVCDGLTAVYGFHNWPGIPTGAVSAKEGIFFAAADTFFCRFIGKGTHGATPAKGINPIIPAADAVLRLRQLHDRFNEQDGSVISVCAIKGGSNSNVIPGEVTIQGTTRYIDTRVGDEMELMIREEVRKAAESCLATCEVIYERKYHLPVINDPDQVRVLEASVSNILGEGAYLPATTHTMTAEDFAFYLDRVPGCMYWLGAGEDHPHLHADTFDFNDDIIEHGVLVLTALLFGERLR